MGVVMLSTVRHRIHVDNDRAQVGHLVLELVLHGARDLVTINDTDVVINRHVDLRPHPVTHPAGPYLVHAVHAGDRSGR